MRARHAIIPHWEPRYLDPKPQEVWLDVIKEGLLTKMYQKLGGGFKSFLCLPLLGEMIQLDKYFSTGLKPSTRKWSRPICLKDICGIVGIPKILIFENWFLIPRYITLIPKEKNKRGFPILRNISGIDIIFGMWTPFYYCISYTPWSFLPGLICIIPKDFQNCQGLFNVFPC